MKSRFLKVVDHFKSLFQQDDLFLWVAVFISIGATIYFSLNFEPSVFVVMCLFAITIVYYLFTKTINIVLLCVTLGFFFAQLRTGLVSHSVLTSQTDKVWIYGKIADIQYLAKGKRVILEDVRIKQYKDIKKIRINIKKADVSVGDYINFQGVLMPPPKPLIYDGFDFSRYLYFKEISAIGYATSKIKVVKKSDVGFFKSLREKILVNINSSLKAPMNGFAAGVLVGDPSSLSKEDYDVIRISGIAHLLAISGMHMVIVVTLLYVTSKFLLNRFEWVILNLDTRKISAIIAILGSFFYLLLSNVPVSAERAFIMSTLVLCGIILDKNSSATRSISIAAILILIITPEQILNPSLQMSFAASIALISSYAYLSSYIKPQMHFFKKVGMYFSSVLISTLIAGTATTPYIIYHFHQYSTYSLITNLVAIPINDFWVMPFGILSILFMPFGLQEFFLSIMSYGIEIIYNVALMVKSLPKSSIYSHGFTPSSMFFIGFGCIIFLMSKARIYFVVPIIIGLVLNYNVKQADILISENFKLYAVKFDDEYRFSTKMGNRFARESWMQHVGQSEVKTLKGICDYNLCKLNKDGKNILIINHSNKNQISADGYDYVFNLGFEPIAGAFNRSDLIGATSVQLDPFEIKSSHINHNRPWN